MREHVNQICRLTAYFEERLSSNENVRVFGGRVLNCFCFTYFEKGLSPAELAKYTRLLGVFINESHRLFLKITNVAGAVVLSVSISYEDTTTQLLDEMYTDLKELIAIFKEKKNDPTLLKFPPELNLTSSESTILTPLWPPPTASPRPSAAREPTSKKSDCQLPLRSPSRVIHTVFFM